MSFPTQAGPQPQDVPGVCCIDFASPGLCLGSCRYKVRRFEEAIGALYTHSKGAFFFFLQGRHNKSEEFWIKSLE